MNAESPLFSSSASAAHFQAPVIRVTPLSPGAGPYRIEVNGRAHGPALDTYIQAERIALWLETTWEELP